MVRDRRSSSPSIQPAELGHSRQASLSAVSSRYRAPFQGQAQCVGRCHVGSLAGPLRSRFDLEEQPAVAQARFEESSSIKLACLLNQARHHPPQ
mmetsp:Transcript_4671/g.7681  ORF Transcript_4671/g.7681 Transcript_4671/m.7681 type:complete len:94 (-) Transcript_4671:67-348(-)